MSNQQQMQGVDGRLTMQASGTTGKPMVMPGEAWGDRRSGAAEAFYNMGVPNPDETPFMARRGNSYMANSAGAMSLADGGAVLDRQRARAGRRTRGFVPKTGRDSLEQALADGGDVGGGMIRGPGSGTSDSIETQKAEGTFIMPADSTKAIGSKALGQMAKVPVRLSNGEFEFTPQQTHNIGAAVLTVLKDATHTPVAQKGNDARRASGFALGGMVPFSRLGSGVIQAGSRDIERASKARINEMWAADAVRKSQDSDQVLNAQRRAQGEVAAYYAKRGVLESPTLPYMRADGGLIPRRARGFSDGGTVAGDDLMLNAGRAMVQGASQAASPSNTFPGNRLQGNSGLSGAPVRGQQQKQEQAPQQAPVQGQQAPAPAQEAPAKQGLDAPWWSREYATAARLSDKSGLELEQMRRPQAVAGDPVKSVAMSGTLGPSAPAPEANPTDRRLAAGTQTAPLETAPPPETAPLDPPGARAGGASAPSDSGGAQPYGGDRTRLTNAQAAAMNPDGRITVTRGANGTMEFSGNNVSGQVSYNDANGQALPGGGLRGRGFSRIDSTPEGSNMVMDGQGNYAFATSGSGMNPARGDGAGEAGRAGRGFVPDVYAGMTAAQMAQYDNEVAAAQANARGHQIAQDMRGSQALRDWNDLHSPVGIARRNAETTFSSIWARPEAKSAASNTYSQLASMQSGLASREAADAATVRSPQYADQVAVRERGYADGREQVGYERSRQAATDGIAQEKQRLELESAHRLGQLQGAYMAETDPVKKESYARELAALQGKSQPQNPRWKTSVVPGGKDERGNALPGYAVMTDEMTGESRIIAPGAASAPAQTVPPQSQRVPGEVYQTPQGPMRWTPQGFTKP